MRRVAALLAAVLLAATLPACGEDDGAEPGAPDGATLMLDFQPNAVHAGIYAAIEDGRYRDAGIRLRVRTPSGATDAPKLLASGDVEFAILDIHDLGLARQAGVDVVGVAAIVQRPLASVIARSDAGIRRPSDLEGERVGVTGLGSDDAVLNSVVSADDGDPSKVRRTTIGFESVKALRAGRVAAATAFWNAEGVDLRRSGTGIRIFKVDRYGAPPYPELVLVTSRRLLRHDRALVNRVVDATVEGISTASRRPPRALAALLNRNRGLDRDVQRAQLQAIRPILEPAGRLDPEVLEDWADWDVENKILKRRPDVREAFDTGLVD